jgi:hypothetical protein
LEHLRRHEPSLGEGGVGQVKYENRELKKVLLEVDAEARIPLTVNSWEDHFFNPLTPFHIYRMPLDIYFESFLVSAAAYSRCFPLL